VLRLDAINMEDLTMALEFRFTDYVAFWWIDPETGVIDLWSEDAADEDGLGEDYVDGRGGIRIDPIESYEGYADMEDFIAGLRDPRARERLQRAINGRGPFRRFKDAIWNSPLETEWYEYHDAVMKRRAIKWLASWHLVDQAEADAALEQV